MRINQVFSNDKKSTYIIAEIGQNHDGSLGQAHAYIDAAKTCGVDAVKFQTHIADEESSHDEPFRVNFSYEDATRYDYWKRMEFTEEQWIGLYEHAASIGLDFLSSPFSVSALRMLDRIGVPAWKFGSGEVFNDVLINEAIATGKPIILSSGLSVLDEIDQQIQMIQGKGNDVVLLHCTTAYPSAPEQIYVNQISDLISRYNIPIGLSDHSGTIYPSLAAVTLGARIIEVHFTMSKLMFGPDVCASVEPDDLRRIVDGSRFIDIMWNNPIEKTVRNDENEQLKEIFSKSLYAKQLISCGEKITEEMLALKKPCKGIPASAYYQIIGRRAKRDIAPDNAVFWEDIE